MEVFMLILLGAIWGGSFPFMRVAAPIVGPIALIQWRMAFAAIALLPFARGDKKRLRPSDYSHFMVLGLINSAIPFSMLAYASVYLSAGFTSILNATAPFFSVIWGTFFFKERLTPKQYSGLALGFLGVWVLLSDKISLKTGAFEANSLVLPLLAGLIAGACYGLTANYSKKYLGHIQTQRVAFWNCFFASMALIPLSYKGPQAWNFEPKVLLCALALGLLSTAIAYLIYFRLIIRTGATKALMVTFLIPVFACLWGWIFLGELVTMKMVMGASIVFWGIRRMMKK